MPLNLAIICAPNRRNGGMLSVDLAAEKFCEALGARATFFRSHHPDMAEYYTYAGQSFTLYSDPAQLTHFDAILFWGDFLGSPMYGLEDFSSLDSLYKVPTPPEETFARWRTLFLLEGYARPAGQRVISVSSNFQGIKAAQSLLSSEMAERLASLYTENFDAIFPRDPVSTELLRKFAPNAARGQLETGLDAAFLLPPLAARRTSIVPTLRYFFGRSGFQGTKRLIYKAGFKTRSVPLKMPRWFRLAPETPGEQWLSAQHLRLGTAQAVLTDTYHICINAMNVGVPVVAISKPATMQSSSVSDFKKDVLFRSLGLSELSIVTEDLNAEAYEKVVFALRASRGEVWQNAMSHLKDLRATYRQRLEEAVKG